MGSGEVFDISKREVARRNARDAAFYATSASECINAGRDHDKDGKSVQLLLKHARDYANGALSVLGAVEQERT